VVSVPLHLHAEVSIAAMQAGKNVFCEKTMAYSIEQAHQMAKTVRETGKTLQVGHQRHYDPSYKHAVKLARDEKVLGRINSFRAQWHRNNDWRRPVPEKDPGGRITDLERHLNWRLYHEYSGGLMTELGSHQMDVCNWILDALPVAVTGMGGVDYWKDGREVWDNVQVVYEYLIEPDNAAFYVPDSGRHERAKEYGKLDEPYMIRAIYSSICANAHDGASEELMGDHGTFILREGKGLFYREGSAPTLDWGSRGEKEKLAGKIATVITSGESHDLSNLPQEDEGEPVSPEPIEKRVEQLQFESFFDCIRTGREPDCNIQIGLNATVCALTANKAIKEGRRIEIDKSLYSA
jgi:predicted dehydrogenase